MEKKLFLFGTCFFLLSSLVIFLAHRNIRLLNRNVRLSEIIKKEEEKVKKTLKELEEQKEKNSSNYQDELPWQLNWKGAIIPLVVCSLIAFPGEKIIEKKFFKITPGNRAGTEVKGFKITHDNRNRAKDGVKAFIIFAILLAILSFSIPPFFLAIAKYKDKSYKERYCLLWQSYWKPFVCFVLSVFFVVLLIGPYDNIFKKNQ